MDDTVRASLSFVMRSHCIRFFANTWSAFAIFQSTTRFQRNDTQVLNWLRFMSTYWTSFHPYARTFSFFFLSPSLSPSFSFPFSVVCRAVFVSVYQVRVSLQFFGFICFVPFSLFPYSSFVRFLRFDIVYRSAMPRRFSSVAPKKITLFVSTFYLHHSLSLFRKS